MSLMQKIVKSLVYVSIFLIPFYIFRFSILGIPTNFFEIFVLISFLSTLHYLLSTKSKIHFGSIWLYLFLLAALVSTFVAPDKREALGILKGWFLVPAILYFCVINNFTKESFNKLSISLYLALTLVSVWAFLQYIGVIGLLFYQIGDAGLAQYLLPGNFRIFGLFESPNYLAMFILPMIYLSLPAMQFIRNKYAKIIFFLPIALALFSLFMTGSRAGIIALVVSFLTFILIKSFASGVAKKAKILVAGIALVMILVVCIFSLGKFNGRSESDSSRRQIWNYSFQMIRIQPVLGVGLGNFYHKIDQLSAGNKEFRAQTLPYALHPHNVFLAVWLNLGIVGLLAFCMILYDFSKKLFADRKTRMPGLIYFVAMLAIIIHGMFDTTYFKNDLAAIFWLIMAFGFLVKQNDNK